MAPIGINILGTYSWFIKNKTFYLLNPCHANFDVVDIQEIKMRKCMEVYLQLKGIFPLGDFIKCGTISYSKFEVAYFSYWNH